MNNIMNHIMNNIVILLLLLCCIVLLCNVHNTEGFTGKLNQATRPTLRNLRRKKNSSVSYLKMKLYNIYRKYL